VQELLAGKGAIVVGGGQTPGETVGNGRATALRFAQEGARVVVVDRVAERAQATADEIVAAGGKATAFAADITDEGSVIALVELARETLGTIDILHNNVGTSLAAGDSVIEDADIAAFERVTRINLTGMVATCKHVLPIMREQRHGVISSIGSLASLIDYPNIAYKTSKAGVVALTQNIAIRFARYGIRANAILPGLMETPMAVESRVGLDGRTREQVNAERAAHVPLLGKQGTAWDVANAAVFLDSDLAGFITGVALPVDGAQALVVG
jgi:NAD(P)-dependent dehydrogenase (short-subunit alcohol dehydrogenase family)